MTRQTYNIKESANRLLRLFRGETPNEQEGTLTPEVLSENQAVSDFVELLAGSLPGETLAFPTSLYNAAVTAGFITGTASTDSSFEYGQIYTHTGSASQTPGTSFAKLTQYDGNGLSTANITPDATNNRIIIGRTGVYKISSNVDYAGTNNSVVEMVLVLGGVEQPQLYNTRTVGGAGDVTGMSMNGIISVSSVPVDIEIFAKCDGGAHIVDVKDAQLVCRRIGSV
jgi:hypothetical protein